MNGVESSCNEIADPEPKATQITAVEVVDEGDVMILSDDPGNSLTAAIRIVEKFKENAPGLPTKIWNKQVKGPWWYNITYENWFILVGIYRLEKLGSSAIGAGIKQAMEQRYGGNIGTDLTWRNHPVDHGQHARHLLTQVATKVIELQETITELQKAVKDQQKISKALLVITKVPRRLPKTTTNEWRIGPATVKKMTMRSICSYLSRE
ncbi:uncharacterized protein FSUBG_2449 [Fusarium subglutinans]|uniref:Uncharacterized protein n=1 Tax=Gibberella subglutinans TaxID=42677 RepID=A0A8H5Q7N7_GIBSU|nr:uncharacterized protein FSUBG_2449 [Fusarium subglutinans]KAF5611170.1 hypothetical protein FSUBG_2449 [Fusarium subglutinans]